MERIGIGVTTFNRNRQLKETISKIKEFTDVPFKLVIIDDGSKYPVKEANFRFKENKGAPIAKNKCLELLEDITEKKYIAGLFMLFPKSVWKLCKFPENNIAFDDVFSKLVVSKGYKLGLIKGLYVYHQYRIWSDTPTKERKHLRK